MTKVDLTTLKSELPRGYTLKIAKAIGITPQAVSIALRKPNPNLQHPAVREAIRLRDQRRKELKEIEEALMD